VRWEIRTGMGSNDGIESECYFCFCSLHSDSLFLKCDWHAFSLTVAHTVCILKSPVVSLLHINNMWTWYFSENEMWCVIVCDVAKLIHPCSSGMYPTRLCVFVCVCMCLLLTDSEGTSDPYARYKAQLSSYRRALPATVGGANKALQPPVTTPSSTPVTEFGTVYGIHRRTPVVTSANVISRQSTSNVVSSASGGVQQPHNVTVSDAASRQMSSGVVASTNITSPPLSPSSNVAPRLSTPSTTTLSDVRPQQSTAPVTTSSNNAVRLSTQTTSSSDVVPSRPSSSTASVTSTTSTAQSPLPTTPWRPSRQSRSVTNEANLSKPDSTASTIRRSELICFYLLTYCSHQVSSVKRVYLYVCIVCWFSLQYLSNIQQFCVPKESVLTFIYLTILFDFFCVRIF